MLHRGFDRLRPKKSKEETDAEKVLRDFEAGKYGPKVQPADPYEKPKPDAKPAPPPETPEEKEIRLEQERRDRVIKATRGK